MTKKSETEDRKICLEEEKLQLQKDEFSRKKCFEEFELAKQKDNFRRQRTRQGNTVLKWPSKSRLDSIDHCRRLSRKIPYMILIFNCYFSMLTQTREEEEES